MSRRNALAVVLLALILSAFPLAGSADSRDEPNEAEAPAFLTQRGTSLLIPAMDAGRGRALFLNKGCVACHTVNGVGGSAGPRLDADRTLRRISVFDFAARIWRGADAMIDLQRLDLGYQVDLRADELADLTAFAHDYREQRKLSEEDIPPKVRRWMNELRL